MNYFPERWVVVEIQHKDTPVIYKIFACWYGGYTSSNNWRLNSGITKATLDGDMYTFEGNSGSVYTCHKDAWGTSGYGLSVLNGIIQTGNKSGATTEILPKETNLLNLEYTHRQKESLSKAPDELQLLVKEFFDKYLNRMEESDSGIEFNPITISCCRVLMLEPLNKLLKKMAKLSNANAKVTYEL